MRETRWRAWQQLHHIHSISLFSPRRSLGTFEEATERTGSTVTVWAVQCTADRESLNVGREERFLHAPLTQLCSAVAGTWNLKTKRAWKRARAAAGETFSIQPASPHPPLPLSLSVFEQALSSHSALIWQRKWIRNSFILLPHIYSFHRLWPLPTCVLISSWRAALHGPQSL